MASLAWSSSLAPAAKSSAFAGKSASRAGPAHGRALPVRAVARDDPEYVDDDEIPEGALRSAGAAKVSTRRRTRGFSGRTSGNARFSSFNAHANSRLIAT